MNLNWGDADPNYFLGRLQGLNVGVNDGEGFVELVTREGLTVLDWDEAAGAGVPGTAEFISWDDVVDLYVF